MSRTRFVPIVVSLIALASSHASAQLYVRGNPSPMPGSIVSITSEGVELDGATRRTIPWHEVKAVRGEMADEAEAYMAIAERAWRAKTRLERRDYELASPLFEILFSEREDVDGPTATLIARGRLACAIREKAYLRALAPFLASYGDDVTALRPSLLPIHPETGLAPSLPPFWTPAEANLAAGVIDSIRTDESAPRPLVSLYLTASADPPALERDSEALVLPRDGSDPAQQLVAAIVESRLGSPAQRRDARETLERFRDEHFGTWIEAWARIAVARSLLREGGGENADRAVIELLHVPSRFADSTRLCELALAFACDALISEGEIDQADRVYDLLRREHAPSMRTVNWLDQRFERARDNDEQNTEDTTT